MFDPAPAPLYVSRRIPFPVDDVAGALDRLPHTLRHDGTCLALRRPPSVRYPRGPLAPARALPARLRRGRVRPTFRVDVEATAWSTDTAELAIRPAGPACIRWPQAFLRAAVPMADHLAELVYADALGAGAALGVGRAGSSRAALRRAS
jgi:hypothetical protein